MNIYHSVYKKIPCICMESNEVRVGFLPEQGAKICSVQYKASGKEFVLQRKGEKYRKACYGQDYLAGECAGIDEMFPNIDAFYCETEPWNGTFLPDHGELWSLEWEHEIKEDEICFRTNGVKLPYSIQKTVRFLNENTISCNYELRNHSPFPIDYIWASHMMLEGEEGCVFAFPDGASKAYCTISESGIIGGYGDAFTYPIIKREDGSLFDIRVHRGENANDYQKFYFGEKMPEGWGMIKYPDGHIFKIDFDKENVPYLGAVQGEGGTFNIRCMFLEPCTGAFDQPVAAKQHRMNSVLAPKGSAKWYLNISAMKEKEK